MSTEPIRRRPTRPSPRHLARIESPPSPPPSVATLATNNIKAALHQGQRVSHTAFGVGVVTSSRRGHTVVCFDEGGPRTFVTSMVELEVLSAPNKWETGPRGKNRPRKTVLVGN